ncbi:MAG TPA: hypothetical protein VHS97_21265 [Isosphaeraceae bacterium]|nr:hypothetical protein [Isosphaeraceae bacterium]
MRIGRWIGKVAFIAATAYVCGCAHGTRDVRKVRTATPLARARAVGRPNGRSDSGVMRTLVTRLGDVDPVVRLAAHEELRKRTGVDFGYVPWASEEERALPMERWRAWVEQGNASQQPVARSIVAPSPPGKVLPAVNPQVTGP